MERTHAKQGFCSTRTGSIPVASIQLDGLAMTQLDQSTLLQLIELIYTAAIQPEQWGAVMHAIGKVYQARYTNFYVANTAQQQVMLFQSIDTEPEVIASWATNFAPHDARIINYVMNPDSKTGLTVTNDDMVDRKKFSQSFAYNEFLAPTECEETLAIIAAQHGPLRVITSINRSERVGRYSAEECRFMDALKPHLQRAAYISTQLSSLSQAQQLSCELMDQLPFGVVAVGHDGKVLEINKRAHQLLHGIDELLIQSGQLLIRDKAANTALQQAIASSITLHTSNHRQNVCIAVPRNDGKHRPLQVLVNPLTQHQSAFALRAGAALVFLFGEDHAPQLNQRVLSELYGLTRAETQLAVQLAQGHTLDQIATLNCISMNTVRTHMKHLFTKTECTTQAQLVRTLLLGPTVMRS